MIVMARVRSLSDRLLRAESSNGSVYTISTPSG